MGHASSEIITVTDTMPLPDTLVPGGTEIDRREFLQVYGSHFVAGALVVGYGGSGLIARHEADVIAAAEKDSWPKRPPAAFYAEGQSYNGQTTLNLFAPGFGDTHPIAETNLWAQTGNLPKKSLTMGLDYGSGEMTLDTLAALVSDKVDLRQIERINYLGRSIGGLYALPLLCKLGVVVENLTLCSAPSCLRNADMGSYGHLVAQLPVRPALALLGKYFANFHTSVQDTGFHFSRNSAQAWQSTMTGYSPVALQYQLIAADGIDIFDHQQLEIAKRIFKPGISRVVYAATDKPATDGTVKVYASGIDFQRFFQNMLKVPCSLVGLNYSGHANLPATIDYMKQLAEQPPTNLPLASK